MESLALAEASSRYIPGHLTPLTASLAPAPPLKLFDLVTNAALSRVEGRLPQSAVLSLAVSGACIPVPVVGVRNHARTWEDVERAVRSTMGATIADSFLSVSAVAGGGAPASDSAPREAPRMLSSVEHLAQGADLFAATLMHLQTSLSRRAPNVSRGLSSTASSSGVILLPTIGLAATSTIQTVPSLDAGVVLPVRVAPTQKYQSRLKALDAYVESLQHALDYTKEVSLSSLVRLAEAVV